MKRGAPKQLLAAAAAAAAVSAMKCRLELSSSHPLRPCSQKVSSCQVGGVLQLAALQACKPLLCSFMLHLVLC